MQVYVDVAVRALTEDSSLITLNCVQHLDLSSAAEFLNDFSGKSRTADKNALPSWVPNWDTTLSQHILAQPISPHCAHGTTLPMLTIDKSALVLNIRGIKLDIIQTCSKSLSPLGFHLHSPGRSLVFRDLWHTICGKDRFDLEDRYVNGESAFFAYTQTLSIGCVTTSSRESRAYNNIPKSEWYAQGAAYLTKALGESEDIALEIDEIAAGGDHFKWSRAANGASSHRCFALTAKGYFALGPKVLEAGDIICVLFGGKMPFCLRPWGHQYLLVGECYVHGLMNGEAIEMLEHGEVVEEEFAIV